MTLRGSEDAGVGFGRDGAMDELSLDEEEEGPV